VLGAIRDAADKAPDGACSLIAHKVPFIVAELGTDADPCMLHLYAALAERERSLIARWTRDALNAAKARGVVLGNPNLADVRNRAVASTMAELIALLRTLPRLSEKFSRAAWPRIVASRDRSMLAALRRHAVANGRRSRSAPSCSGSLPEMAND
jgi:DNA invertase Pin-like site-specific DNA recombinase